MSREKSGRTAKLIGWIILGTIGICLLAVVVSAIVNRSLPTQSSTVESLTVADLARLAEAQHLRQSLGEVAWPGWGDADIPIIFYNESYAFLTGLDQPAAGWVKVPETALRGGQWEPVDDLAVEGITVFHQPVENADRVIGAFTVRVGDRWAAAFGTRQWSQVGFYQGFRQELPPGLREVVPYPLLWQLLMGSTDRYITTLLHESFHAYQGTVAPQKLIDAELSARLEDQYPWESSQDAWQSELDALAEAVQSQDRDEQLRLACQFLLLRQERRFASQVSPVLVAYERKRDWLEGLAKYAELAIGLAAARSPDYQPVANLADLDKDFKGYAQFEQFYLAQLGEVSRMGGRSEETRFYYGGMAQAVLLDRFNPSWKSLAMQEGIYLEDMLDEALKNFNGCLK